MDKFDPDQYDEQLDTYWTGQIRDRAFFLQSCTTVEPIIIWAVMVKPFDLLMAKKNIYIRQIELVKPGCERAPGMIGVMYWENSRHRHYKLVCLDVGWDLDGNTGRVNRFFESLVYAEEYAAFLRLRESNPARVLYQVPPKKQAFSKVSIDPTKTKE